MHMVPLSAAKRTERKPRKIRHQGLVPGVVYGNSEHTQIQCEERQLCKVYASAGESTLVELDVDNKKVPVLFHAIQFDPVTDRPIHVDFYAVDLTKEVETQVPLRLTGESPVTKDLGAIIVTALDHVTVRALPQDLPHDLPVDLSTLAAFRDTITVSSLTVPKGVTILEPPGTVLVVAQEPREEEVEEVKPPEGAEVAPAAEGAAAAAKGAALAVEGEVKEKAEKEEKTGKAGK